MEKKTPKTSRVSKKTGDLHNKNCAATPAGVKKPLKNSKIYEIVAKDLPLACPTPKMTLWNAHPKVYLAIEETGRAICPYCSTEFILKNSKT